MLVESLLHLFVNNIYNTTQTTQTIGNINIKELLWRLVHATKKVAQLHIM